MTVPPTPRQPEYAHANATERSANGSSDHNKTENLCLGEWMWILTMLTALVGLMGNSIVLWLLGFRIKRNPFSIYILNLAGADSLFLCCSFLISVREFLRHLYDSFMHKLLQYVTYAFYTVSVSLLAAISTERCLSVLFPFWYRCHRPKCTSAAVCTVLWTLGCLLEVVGFVICYFVSTGLEKHACLEFFITELVWFIILTCVLCMSSLTLLLRVQCSSQRRQPPRLYLLILLTVLVFLICGMPMEIGEFISRFNILLMPQCLRQLLACVNSSANPFIYFFMGKQMHKKKQPLMVVLQRALGDEQDLEGETRDATYTNTPEPSF